MLIIVLNNLKLISWKFIYKFVELVPASAYYWSYLINTFIEIKISLDSKKIQYLNILIFKKSIYKAMIKSGEFNFYVGMGMGDFIFCVPFLSYLHSEYKFPINLYVSKSADQINDSSIEILARSLPFINSIFYYENKSKILNYKTYTLDAISEKYKDTDPLALPLMYHSPSFCKREDAVFQWYGIRSIIHNPTKKWSFFSGISQERIQYIEQKYIANNEFKNIIFIHLETRSSNVKLNILPDIIRLMSLKNLTQGFSDKLIQYIVVDSKGGAPDIPNENILFIDKTELLIDESLYLINRLIEICDNFHAICVNSLFWSFLPGFDVPIIGIHVIDDDNVVEYWSPEIKLITNKIRPLIPKSQQSVIKSQVVNGINHYLNQNLSKIVLHNLNIID